MYTFSLVSKHIVKLLTFYYFMDKTAVTTSNKDFKIKFVNISVVKKQKQNNNNVFCPWHLKSLNLGV